MSTIAVRKFLSRYQSDAGWSHAQKVAYDKYTDDLAWAWENWEDEDTREFWEGDTKPEDFTESFRVDYAKHADDEELADIISAFDF